MTEGKPKRSYWRRGPRKKKGAEDAAGTAAATPQTAEAGDPASESPAAGSPDTGDSFVPPAAPEPLEAGFDAVTAEAPTVAAESAPGEMEAGSASAGEAPPKGRRRSRRRGKKKTGDAPAQALSEESGETRVPAEEPRPFDVVGWGGLESPARGSFEPPATVEAEPAGGEMPPAPTEGPPGTAPEPGGSRENPGRGAAAGAVAVVGRGKDRRRARRAARHRPRLSTGNRRRTTRKPLPRAVRRPATRNRMPPWSR